MIGSGSATREHRTLGLLAIGFGGFILASLMLGLRPSAAQAGAVAPQVCERPLDVVLVIDRSGSMDLETGGQSRLGWAKDAAVQLVNGLDANGGVGGSGLHQVGLTTYGNRDNSDGSPAGFTRDVQLNGASAASVNAAITAYSDSAGTGNTPFRYGMADGADNMLDGDRVEVDGVPVLQVLIFLSDGRPNPDSLAPGSRPSAAEITAYLAAADQAYGIAVGPDGQGEPLSEPDLDLMHAISNPDPDNFRHVVDAASLPNLFADIQEELLCGDIHITKTPDPAGPVAPGTEVTYTYDVTNSGETPLINVSVVDDQCAPVTGPSKSGGDGDDQLEAGETWTYTCAATLEVTTTNEACADGDFIGGGSDSACAEVTVEVTQPTPPPPTPTPTPVPTPEPGQPGISILKSHDVDDPVEEGTLVTYTYEVENTGDLPLSQVDVVDYLFDSSEEACVDVVFGSGDVGDDGILGVDEIWTFSCSTSLVVTTANTACVSALVVDSDVSVEACADDLVRVGEGSVGGGTSIPEPSLPNSAASLSGVSGPVVGLLFGLILVSVLGALAYANVRTARQRR